MNTRYEAAGTAQIASELVCKLHEIADDNPAMAVELKPAIEQAEALASFVLSNMAESLSAAA